MVTGVYVAAYAVFGSVESDEFDAVGFVENVDGRFEFIVDAGGIGDEADAFAFEAFEAAVAEHFDAGFDLCHGGDRDECQSGC